MNGIKKYLTTWAEQTGSLEMPVYDHAVVVPLHSERFEDWERLRQSLQRAADFANQTALVIACLNRSESSTNDVATANAKWFRQVCDSHFIRSENLFFRDDNLGILILDRSVYGPPLPLKQGVGLARKLGTDLALRLFYEGRIRGDKFFHTDADATVREDYFEIPSGDWAVLHMPFRHLSEGDREGSHQFYEQYLRYYWFGLRRAGSPYAYPSLGSCLVTSATHYAMVRGFPKRLAAEDFHIMAKLSKVGGVQIGTSEVRLWPRKSERVPFGTGRATAEIVDKGRDNFLFYHPETFDWLKQVLESASTTDFSWSEFSRSLNAAALGAFEEVGGRRTIEEASRRRSQTDRLRTFHHSFDALATLQFFHRVRDSGALPAVRFDVAASAPWWPEVSSPHSELS